MSTQKKSFRNEHELQMAIRAEATEKGILLFRNNVGVCVVDGRYIRFGLANDSKQLNQNLKSSDLIGIRPIIITPDHVGLMLGQFVAREVKLTTRRNQGQTNFINLINNNGGDACYASDVGTL